MKKEKEPGMLTWQFWYKTICGVLFMPTRENFLLLQCLIMVVESALSIFIIKRVPYTEIDWSTYMQQVECYIKKDVRNYSEIGGDTGPIVYPAGHLTVFTLLYHVTDAGKNIRQAQFLFSIFYGINLLLNFRIVRKMGNVPPFVMLLMSVVGYRIHSIFMLRLFNDPIALLAFYLAVNLFFDGYYAIGCVVYSFAVSIKMNVLLFAPALYFTLVSNVGPLRTSAYIAICGFFQLWIGSPFLLYDWKSYMMRSFELGRVFLFKWTVNWRFLPEEIFLDKRFHLFLLISHIVVLYFFASSTWFRKNGGMKRIMQNAMKNVTSKTGPSEMYFAFCTANLVGIAFSRSLHYQFYSWYYHQLPILLFFNFPIVSKVQDIPWLSVAWKFAVLLGVELCWNVYPSTWWSSALLHFLHFVILYYLMVTRSSIIGVSNSAFHKSPKPEKISNSAKRRGKFRARKE